MCINQDDLKERGSQVARMAYIFGSARQVFIWLGEPQENHETTFSFIRFFKDLIPEVEWGNLKAAEFTADTRSKLLEYDSRVTLESGLVAFTSIAKKPWFERLWTVQEANLARFAFLVCGSDYVFLSTARRAFKNYAIFLTYGLVPHMDARRELRAAHLYNVRQFGSGMQGCSPSFHLLDLLLQTSSLQASEPRDRVFALLSLAFKDDAYGLPVDYELSLSDLWQIMTNAIILALPATQSNLQTVEGSSFVVDFGSLSDESVRKYHWYLDDENRRGAGGFDEFEVLPISKQPNFLKTPGIILSTIQEVLENSNIPSASITWASAEGLVEVATELLDWQESCLQFLQEWNPDIERGEFVDILEMNPVDWTFYGGAEKLQMVRSALQTTLACRPECPMDYGTLDDVASHLGPFFAPNPIKTHLDFTRMLATTSDGLMIWIPNRAQRGDHVCLIQGAPAPFIVRDRDDGILSIVGDAYVHGIMRGEAWPIDPDKIGVVTFE